MAESCDPIQWQDSYMLPETWPRVTYFPQLPSAVTSTVDQPLGFPSLDPTEGFFLHLCVS
jgi:hypothetical protein